MAAEIAQWVEKKTGPAGKFLFYSYLLVTN